MEPEPKLAEAVTDRNRPAVAPRSNEQLADALARWLRVLNRSPYTIKTMLRHVRAFGASLNGRGFLEADRADVRAFGASKRSVFMRAQAVWALRQFYDFLILGGLARRNIAREVCTPKLPKRIPIVPTVEEVGRLMRAVEDVANGEAE